MKPYQFLEHLQEPNEKVRHLKRRDILHEILTYYIYFFYSPKVKEIKQKWRSYFGDETIKDMLEKAELGMRQLPPLDEKSIADNNRRGDIDNVQDGKSVLSKGCDPVAGSGIEKRNAQDGNSVLSRDHDLVDDNDESENSEDTGESESYGSELDTDLPESIVTFSPKYFTTE